MNFEKATVFTVAQMGTLEQLKEKIGQEQPEKYINMKGENLLHCAIRGRNIDNADFLINMGNLFDTPNNDGETPLHYATKLIETEFVNHIVNSMLLKGYDINKKNKFGNNPFFAAIINCDYEDYDLIKIMLPYKPDMTSENNAGMSVIKIVEEDNNSFLLELLKG